MSTIKSMEKNMGKLSDEASTDSKEVVANTEALLKATANQGGEKMAEVRAKVEESLRIVKARMAEAQSALVVRTQKAAKATDVYVHENPWQAIGVAAVVGLVIGFLLDRR